MENRFSDTEFWNDPEKALRQRPVRPLGGWPCLGSSREDAATLGGDGGSKVETRPLEKLDGNPSERLAKAVLDRETIVVFGPSYHDRLGALCYLVSLIPGKDSRIVVLEEDIDNPTSIFRSDLILDQVRLSFDFPGGSGMIREDVIRMARSARGDRLIVPDMAFSDIETINRHFAPGHNGIIAAVDDDDEDAAVCTFADVLVAAGSHCPPHGIAAVWARPSLPSSFPPVP